MRELGKQLVFPNNESGTLTGLTKREYFASQAPNEPQPWFKPVMPPKPVLPSEKDELTKEEQDSLEYDDGNEWSPKIIAFNERYQAASKALRLWDEAYPKELYAQWPAAWADNVLAGLEQSSDSNTSESEPSHDEK